MSKKKDETRQISVRFPNDLHKRIDEEAQEGDRSFNAQVIRLLRECYQLRESQEQGKREEGK